MIDGDTIYTLNDCAKRSLQHRHKASALWVLDNLWVSSVQPVWDDAWFEVKGCDGEDSVATSNRRVLAGHHDTFLAEFNADLRIAEPTALRWAFRRESHPLHENAVELVEAVNALADYPIVDEMDLSELEYEWAEEAVEPAWEEAKEDVVREATKDLSGVYDDTDFHLEHLHEGWVRDAMSSEWWAQTKDGVRFPQMDGDTRIKDAVEKVIEMWREEFKPDLDICPMDAERLLQRIFEIAKPRVESPAHALEMWRGVAAIILDPQAAL